MGLWLIPTLISAGVTAYQGYQQRSAAQDANDMRSKQAKAAFKRQVQQYEIGWSKDQAQWAWDTAQVEAARYVDRQKEANYNQRMGWLVDGALKNLELNSAALYDKYVVEEGLRAKQEALTLDEGMSTLLSEQEAARQDSLVQSGRIATQAMEAQLETSKQLGDYMRAIQQRSLEGTRIIQEQNDKSAQIQSEITLNAAADTIERDIAMVLAIEKSSGMRARLAARQGNSSTAVRASKNKLQELGRTYGKMLLDRQARNEKAANFNATFGIQANAMAQLGNQMQQNADAMKYAGGRYAAQAKSLELQQLGIQASTKMKADVYSTKGNAALKRYQELMLPSFTQAQKQGQRDFAALVQQTQQKLNEGSVPYNKAIIFDPLKPIKGLAPSYEAPVDQYVPSLFDIGLNAAGAAFDTAMQFSYTDPSTGQRKLPWQ